MPNKQNYTIYLTYAGALPFIICCALIYYHQLVTPLNLVTHLAPKDMLITYGVVINSFLCGTLWGQHINPLAKTQAYRLALVSIINSIAVWLIWLLAFYTLICIVLAASFLWLLAVDYALYNAQVITQWYIKLRYRITIIVVISLLFAGFCP